MSEPIKTRHLGHNDLTSSTWELVLKEMRDRLAALREENDFGDAEITAKRRGRIAELKDWLAFGEATMQPRHEQAGGFADQAKPRFTRPL